MNIIEIQLIYSPVDRDHKYLGIRERINKPLGCLVHKFMQSSSLASIGDWCRERDSLEAAGVEVTQSIRCGSQKHSWLSSHTTTWYSVGLLVPHSLCRGVSE